MSLLVKLKNGEWVNPRYVSSIETSGGEQVFIHTSNRTQAIMLNCRNSEEAKMLMDETAMIINEWNGNEIRNEN